ncbi:hypothetical protein [Oryza sativa Japonica Group]|uniref:Uncharacterized protein n=1 Tax=Oryza sativa subsp. japonica TaxID=39947 RepID=Q5NAF8_ORYSJ|nr:hypothetical protein [Oryza sativa Japonica Group]BAD81548.1 hypothetical protein [Oryza sativa Japonica Group]
MMEWLSVSPLVRSEPKLKLLQHRPVEHLPQHVHRNSFRRHGRGLRASTIHPSRSEDA